LSLEQQMKQTEYNQELFFDAIKKAYEKGMNEKEMTVQKIVEDLKNDLKNTLLR
jgi:tRNA A-37 threonylcarbamoyl transferase component Bud32